MGHSRWAGVAACLVIAPLSLAFVWFAFRFYSKVIMGETRKFRSDFMELDRLQQQLHQQLEGQTEESHTGSSFVSMEPNDTHSAAGLAPPDPALLPLRGGPNDGPSQNKPERTGDSSDIV